MAGPTPGLPLSFPSEREAHTPSEDANRATVPSLWLALVFPRLALEVLAPGHEAAPCVTVEQAQDRRRIHTASKAAEAAGITPGMPVNAAYALCPTLRVHELDDAARRMRLEQLAHWAGRYTSRVSLAPPRALLLEIQGSLRLFGGLTLLHRRIADELAATWTHEFHCAAAPTPAAGLLLAGNGVHALITDRAALRSALGPLPVSALPLDKKRQRQLASAGIRILRDLWRLPAAELARRFGPELTDYIDRALGRRADPHAAFTFPKRFEAMLPLPMEVRDHDLLLTAIRQLIDELVDFLRARDAAVDRCLIRLHHENRSHTVVPAGLREAMRDGDRLMRVLTEHFHRLALEAPATAIELIAERLQPHAVTSGSLLASSDTPSSPYSPGQDITALLERLQARLGRAAVRGLHVTGDARPEHTTAEYAALFRSAGPAQATGDRHASRRPLWLLPRPRPLPQREQHPCHHDASHIIEEPENAALFGPAGLRIIAGPERIETGWWDGDDIRRDYYVASNGEGRRLWIFRDLREGRWYLHGLFG